jgi:hypothetical protein
MQMSVSEMPPALPAKSRSLHGLPLFDAGMFYEAAQ